MATNFPTSLDSFTNPTPVSDTNTVSHAGQHQNHNDSITALEVKVGVTGSAVNTTLDYKTAEITGGDRGVGKTATQVMTNKTLSTGTKILIGSDATGDTYYNGGSGTLTRVPIGSTGQILTVAGGIPIWSSPTATNTNYAVDSGVANAYIANLSPALATYTAGVLVQFKASNANTTASTVNINGLGVKTIKKSNGNDLSGGEIVSGQVVELEYDGTNFQIISPTANTASSKFGGTGTDGALSVSSGTTNIDLGSAAIVIKNYSSISITGTGSITFTNPNASGTIVYLKSQGNVTITPSTVPCIDLRGIGGSAQTLGTGTTIRGVNGTNGTIGGLQLAPLHTAETIVAHKAIYVFAGSGGGNGDNGDLGGRGGGGMVIECGGALNFTGTINASGSDGAVGVGADNAGGGGGAAGLVVMLYNTLTANSGTITATGGNGGNGGTVSSGTGILGGSGAGSIGGAGGAGGSGNPGVPGNAGGPGAGGGGKGVGASGGTGGASIGGIVIQNTFLV